MKTVLSTQGGGFRGVYTVKILSQIKDLYKYDLIVSNSTGSISGAGLSIGMTPENILDIYLTEGKKIFQPSLGYKIKSGNGLFLPKYETKTLESVLKKVFGDKKLSDMDINFMCNGYNLTKNEPILFKNYKEEFKDLPIWLVVKASCSAPTYFASTIVKGDMVCDGGVTESNLCLNGFIEMKKKYPNEPIQVIDIGTGEFKREYKIIPEGMKDWASSIINLFMDANSTTPEYVLKKIKTEEDIYIKYNKQLAWDIQLDDVSDKAIKELLK